jgi:hypothetical protein
LSVRNKGKVYLKQFDKLCTRESPNTKRRDQSSRVNTRRGQVEPWRAFARQQSCRNSGHNKERQWKIRFLRRSHSLINAKSRLIFIAWRTRRNMIGSYDGTRIRRDTRPQICLQLNVLSLFNGASKTRRTHSFATGPVMAEPFISPLGLTITPALS